uniref:Uncharacterized protein n=1 Tax=Musa acuminata subsp. malaccensis TaxID=214687 RepID=A0A804IDV3_MUSAM
MYDVVGCLAGILSNLKAEQEFDELDGGEVGGSSGAGVDDHNGEHGPGWRTVPAHDPVVKDAAHHAVQTIQQRSNSLAPYELLEVLLARAEIIFSSSNGQVLEISGFITAPFNSQVVEDIAKFDMLIKVKRGSKEEKLKVEVHKDLEGTFHLNQMQQEHLESASQ